MTSDAPITDAETSTIQEIPVTKQKPVEAAESISKVQGEQMPANGATEEEIPAGAEEEDIDSDNEDSDEDLVDELPSIEEALKMIENGEQLLKESKELEAAAEELSKAVAALSAHYGDGAPECADALHLYGRALYLLAVEKSSVFNKPGADEEKLLSPQAVTALTQKLTGKHLSFSEDAEASEGEAQNADEGEDVENDDMEIAYEVLVVAATAYEKIGTEASKRSLADVYLLIGHCQLEADRPEEALADYKKAMKMKQEQLEEGSREVAEARYYYALTLEATGKYPEALELVQLAIESVQKKLEVLKQSQPGQDDKGKNPASEDDKNVADEINELSEMLKDLEAKIEDINAKMESVDKAFAAAQEDSPAPVKAEAGPVNDLTGLVKKRKLEAEDEGEVKKVKTDEEAGNPQLKTEESETINMEPSA